MSDDATRLAELLARENEALAALDYPRAAALLPDKMRAAEALQVTGAAWPASAQVVQQLAALAEENRRLLRHAMAVQSQVVEIVASATRHALQQSDATYGSRRRHRDPALPAVTLSARA